MAKISHDSETPAHGQQVHSVCAFIHHDFSGVSKVFLPKRAATKKFLPGLYELPGGHVDLYEDVSPALRREIKEEFNKEITLGDSFAAFTYENQVKGSHTIEVIYFARFVGLISDITLNSEDHSRCEWMSEQEVIRRKSEIIPTDHVSHSHEEDPEYLAILKGFKFLRGEPINFG